MGNIPARSDVDQKLTWDLTTLYASEQEYEAEIDKILSKVMEIEKKYRGKMTSPERINACIDGLNEVEVVMNKLVTYTHLNMDADVTNPASQVRAGKLQTVMSTVSGALSFIQTDIVAQEDQVIEQAIAQSETNAHFLKNILRTKPHTLSAETEQALALLAPAISSPYRMYSAALHGDLKFDDYQVDGEKYSMTFNEFESTTCLELDTKKRRAAYENFYKNLEKLDNTMGTNYQQMVSNEKILSDFRKYEDVFESLLFGQEVTRKMYDNQIDLIYKHLAPHMRRYAKLIQEEYKLDRMTYADLKLPLMHDVKIDMSIEEAKSAIRKAISMMGEEYMDIIDATLNNRGVDYVQNIGKAGGAYCAPVYGNHSFILMSWGNDIEDSFTLVHELGHAGHFGIANKYNPIINTECSMYFVESPSTMNELLLYNSLYNHSQDERVKKYLTATLVGKTYYHNFVTHLTEAHFQRKVYKAVEAGEGLSTEKFNQMKLDSLREFWGDEVEIPEYAGRTWMRQQHYYLGLYPYTYSAGLTISTAAAKRVFEGDKELPALWLSMLKSAGVKTPLELGKMVGLDLSTEKPLLETIDFIGSLIDRI